MIRPEAAPAMIESTATAAATVRTARRGELMPHHSCVKDRNPLPATPEVLGEYTGVPTDASN